jgi:hypothetical protein
MRALRTVAASVMITQLRVARKVRCHIGLWKTSRRINSAESCGVE